MKKYISLISLLSLFLTSCTIDWKDENKVKIEKLENQITELKKEKENDLFKKKQECLNLFDSINLRLKNHKSDYIFELEEIFYSPILKQCLYIDYFKANYGTIKRLMSIGSKVGGEPINNISCKYDNENLKSCLKFENKIKELKGE